MNTIHVRVSGDPVQVEKARQVIHTALTSAGYAPPEKRRRHLHAVRDDERTTA